MAAGYGSSLQHLIDMKQGTACAAPVQPMIARAKCAPIRYHCRIMRKRSSVKLPRPPSVPPPRAPTPARNPNVNQQTRRMLGQHYRAKYGVK